MWTQKPDEHPETRTLERHCRRMRQSEQGSDEPRVSTVWHIAFVQYVAVQ